MDAGLIFGWIITNKIALIQIYLSLIGVASVIVKLTPTLKDDTFLKSVIKFTGRYLAINRK